MMARGEGKPQLVDGYTKIANEILEELVKVNLCAYETRVLLFIIRKTYGWHKKADWIPLSQIVEGTGIAKANVWRAVRRLERRNIISRMGYKRIAFQKDYRKWIRKLSNETTKLSDGTTLISDHGETGKEELSNETTPVVHRDNKKLSNGKTSKDNKETSSKEITPATSMEQDFLNILWSLHSWKREAEDDLLWLREFTAEFPELTPGDVKGCRDYHSEGPPPKHKGAWKTRLRKWAKKAREFNGDGSRPWRDPILGLVADELNFDSLADKLRRYDDDD